MGRFFEDRKNYIIALLMVSILDITSTLHLVARYGAIMEKNPIVSFLMMKPYFSLVYVGLYFIIISLTKHGYTKGFWRNFLWGFLIFYFVFAPMTNIIFSFWMMM
jgi:hypothetical protein